MVVMLGRQKELLTVTLMETQTGLTLVLEMEMPTVVTLEREKELLMETLMETQTGLTLVLQMAP